MKSTEMQQMSEKFVALAMKLRELAAEDTPLLRLQRLKLSDICFDHAAKLHGWGWLQINGKIPKDYIDGTMASTITALTEMLELSKEEVA